MYQDIAVSSWTFNKLLTSKTQDPEITLYDIPGLLDLHGYKAVEICNFHITSTDVPSLRLLRVALENAGVRLVNVLVDTGDISASDPLKREAEIHAVKKWIDIASALGSDGVRVIAGRLPATSEALAQSAETLQELAVYAAERDIAICTENWYGLLDSPEDVIELLKLTEGNIGLKLDFGNWPAPRKFDDLRAIAPYASTTHSKPALTPAGKIDHEDFLCCLQSIESGRFEGRHVLVYDGHEEVWGALDELKRAVTHTL
jgi:sugar phosphate isomerase/epimerase